MSEKIIALLESDGSLSSATLATQISKTSRTVERVLRELRESGVIERIGPDKGGHWVVNRKTK
jgi:predicted HTH transcriptional regulator